MRSQRRHSNALRTFTLDLLSTDNRNKQMLEILIYLDFLRNNCGEILNASSKSQLTEILDLYLHQLRLGVQFHDIASSLELNTTSLLLQLRWREGHFH